MPLSINSKRAGGLRVVVAGSPACRIDVESADAPMVSQDGPDTTFLRLEPGYRVVNVFPTNVSLLAQGFNTAVVDGELTTINVSLTAATGGVNLGLNATGAVAAAYVAMGWRLTSLSTGQVISGTVYGRIGNALVPDMTAGDWRLEVAAGGCFPSSTVVTVLSGNVTGVSVTLTPSIVAVSYAQSYNGGSDGNLNGFTTWAYADAPMFRVPFDQEFVFTQASINVRNVRRTVNPGSLEYRSDIRTVTYTGVPDLDFNAVGSTNNLIVALSSSATDSAIYQTPYGTLNSPLGVYGPGSRIYVFIALNNIGADFDHAVQGYFRPPTR